MEAMETIELVEADLDLPEHRQAVLDLIDAYARDPMGAGQPLPIQVRDALIPGLRRHPTTLILLAFSKGRGIGIAVCFLGFSTFAARPLLNIHDLAVLPEYRGGGVGRLLLGEVERRAQGMGCCKVTLEVLANNHRAMTLYGAAGYRQASYREAAGGALFYAKAL